MVFIQKKLCNSHVIVEEKDKTRMSYSEHLSLKKKKKEYRKPGQRKQIPTCGFFLTVPMTRSLTVLLKKGSYLPVPCIFLLFYNVPVIFLPPVPLACSHSLEQCPAV